MKLLLVCSGGMSSAIVVKAIEQEAQKQAFAAEVKSVGTGQFADELANGWDMVLVAPQVRHRLSVFEEAAANFGTPVLLIPPQGYTPFGAGIILNEIRKKLG